MDLNLTSLSSLASRENRHPYASSISSSASSSSSSVFSSDCVSSRDTPTSTSSSSFSSDPHQVIWDNENADPYCQTRPSIPHHPTSTQEKDAIIITSRAPKAVNIIPPDQRQHPRRTKCGTDQASERDCLVSTCPRPPPSLVRQSDRKVNFVDSLVDSAAQIVEIIWPLSVVACRSDNSPDNKGVLPLRTFIQETLRRSRTSYSTLQVALYYLILIKACVPKHDFTMEQPNDGQSLRAMQCGRRMFLAALILASKYLQDRNYSARAWSKISGLNTLEINMNEMTFLSAVNWKLHISEAVFQRWTDIVLKYTPSAQPPSSPSASPIFGNTTCDWRSLIPSLTPNLDIVDIRTPPSSPKDFGSSCLSDISNFISKPVSGNVFDHSQPSDEQTPTTMYKAPLRRVQPAPPLAHMAPLPTPIMTSQLNGYNTPAASARSVPLKSSSMGCAMAQAENLCTSRITLDQIKRPQLLRPAGLDAYRTGSGRRSSLARSCSSTSSPDSMVSDSSRSSRSSSISSVSSSICAPIQSNLAVQASCRNAKLLQRENSDANPKGRLQSLGTDKLPGIATWDLTNSPETYTGPLGSVPDFTNFSLGPPRVTWAQPGFTDAAAGATRGLGDFVGNRQRPSPQPRAHHASVKGRKRHRSSENLALQQNVRDLVTIRTEEDSMVLPDRTVADSFLLSSPVDLDIKAVQSPTHVSPYRLPVQKKTGRKRACCAEEAGWSKDRSQGPGIWKDIL